MGKRLQQLREVAIAPRMRTTKSPQPVFGNRMDSAFGVVSPHQHRIPDTCGGARKQKQFLIALTLANIFEAIFLRIEHLQCIVETFLACFFAFLIFDPKRQIRKGYGICLVAIFLKFQNGLNF